MSVETGQRWSVSGVLPACHLSARGVRSAGPAAPGPYVVHATRPAGKVVLRRPTPAPDTRGQGVDYVFTNAMSLRRAAKRERHPIDDERTTHRTHRGDRDWHTNDSPQNSHNDAAHDPAAAVAQSDCGESAGCPSRDNPRRRKRRSHRRQKRLAQRIAIHVERGRTALAHRLVERARFNDLLRRLPHRQSPQEINLAGTQLDSNVCAVLAADRIYTLADLLRRRPARVANLPGMTDNRMTKIYALLKQLGFRRNDPRPTHRIEPES